MTNRMVSGDAGGGSLAIRVSRPGHDVLAEPFGSTAISFDTRLVDIGTVIAAGLIVCGGSPVYFPTMNYVPIVKINKWDGWLYEDSDMYIAPSGGLASRHAWIPAVAIPTTSSLSVVPFPGTTFNPLSFYNPTGHYYLYSIFAAG